MFDDKPILKDRLQAAGAFSGIALAAVAGFDLLITGGFDFLTPGSEIREIAPSAYVTVERSLWSPEARVIPLSSTEPYFAQDPYYTAISTEELAGSRDEMNAADERRSRASQQREDAEYRRLEREIQALYQQETYAEVEPIPTEAVEEIAPIDAEEAAPVEESKVEVDAAPQPVEEVAEDDSAAFGAF